MKRNKIFTRKLDGQVLEIGNWEARTSDGDAFVGVPVSESGLRMLRDGRSIGKSDSQIFREMHRNERLVRHTLTLEDLTTSQILTIARDLLDEELGSLNRLARADLIRLVQKIASIKKVKVEIDLRMT